MNQHVKCEPQSTHLFVLSQMLKVFHFDASRTESHLSTLVSRVIPLALGMACTIGSSSDGKWPGELDS